MKCSLVKQMFHSRFLGPFSMSQTLVKLYKLCQKTTVSIYLIYLIYLNLENIAIFTVVTKLVILLFLLFYHRDKTCFYEN